MKKRCVFFWACVCVQIACATTYYVDSADGSDEAVGTSPVTAWRTLKKVTSAQKMLKPGDVVRFKRGGLWRGQLRPASGAPHQPITYTWYGKGPKPILQASVARSAPNDWEKVSDDLWRTHPSDPLPRDIGIFICNHGEKWGAKKFIEPEFLGRNRPEWKPHTRMTTPLDFWYDTSNRCVLVKYPQNPGEAFASIELAQGIHVVNQEGAHDVVYDGLTVRYGGNHGFAGGSTHHITIRNCDIYWIGGSLQFWSRDPKTKQIRWPVRFGNGIEFWNDCHHNLVERNRLWEIYDAALTNQGQKSTEENIIWRDNVIWNCEYSFEYWNAKLTQNVLFEHNTCVDAGYGWAHTQRHNPNGSHLMYYSNRAATTNFVVRNNLFIRCTEWTSRSMIDWRSGLTHDYNLIWNEGNIPVMRWLEFKGAIKKGDWNEYRSLGFDPHGAFARPEFVNPSKRDYRLKKGSAGATLASDGTAVGARNMPGLDRDQSL